MKREYPEGPIVGVGAVVFDDEAVLLVRRNQDPARGQWSLLGGVVELGETLREAVERELREELSINVEIGGLIGVYDRIFRDRKNRIRYHYVLVDYWSNILSGRPEANSDISETQLVPLSNLNAFSINQELRETIWKAVKLRNRTLQLNDRRV